MEIVIETIAPETVKTEGERNEILSLLTSVLEEKGFQVTHVSVSEMEKSKTPMGDYSLEEETYFKSQITRKLPRPQKLGGGLPESRKVKDCKTEVCSVGE